MKGRVIVLDTPRDRASSAALMVDGRLEDLRLGPRPGSEQPEAGDIEVVRVKRKLPKGGAFCEMASGSDGFLRDAKSVREGEAILAQVLSLPEPGKAVTLSTTLLFKGPRLILTPGAPGVNVSRKIGNQTERARLMDIVKAAVEESKLPDGAETGAIIRSAARGEPEDTILREFDVLVADIRLCAELRKMNRPATAKHVDPMTYALREWVFPRPDQILCAPDLFEEISRSAQPESPGMLGDANFLPALRRDTEPFEAAGVHDAMVALASAEIHISGGRMTVEPTRALVAVDVDTGSDFSPAAGLKINLAAAADLPRQLRLRGLGGQIAVDFAPMPKQHRKRLDEALAKAFRADPIETTLVGWTKLGLFELQRKRERRPLAEIWSP